MMGKLPEYSLILQFYLHGFIEFSFSLSILLQYVTSSSQFDQKPSSSEAISAQNHLE